MTAPPDERYYDGIAERYDEWHDPYDLDRRLEAIFEALGPIRGLRLLDAGAGTGHFSARAAREGARVVSVDIAPRMLAIARRRSGAPAVCGDLGRLPFRSGAFDAVVSSEVVEHVAAQEAALREIVRVSAAGGRVAVSTPNRLWWPALVAARALGLRRFAGREAWFSWNGLAEALRAAGLRIDRRFGLHLLPFQIAPLRPLLRRLDRLGDRLGRFCVNQVVVGTPNR